MDVSFYLLIPDEGSTVFKAPFVVAAEGDLKNMNKEELSEIINRESLHQESFYAERIGEDEVFVTSYNKCVYLEVRKCNVYFPVKQR